MDRVWRHRALQQYRGEPVDAVDSEHAPESLKTEYYAEVAKKVLFELLEVAFSNRSSRGPLGMLGLDNASQARPEDIKSFNNLYRVANLTIRAGLEAIPAECFEELDMLLRGLLQFDTRRYPDSKLSMIGGIETATSHICHVIEHMARYLAIEYPHWSQHDVIARSDSIIQTLTRLRIRQLMYLRKEFFDGSSDLPMTIRGGNITPRLVATIKLEEVPDYDPFDEPPSIVANTRIGCPISFNPQQVRELWTWFASTAHASRLIR